MRCGTINLPVGDLFGGHEALGAPALFALVDVVDESGFLNLGARKSHLFTALDAVWWIVQGLRLIHAKLIHVLKKFNTKHRAEIDLAQTGPGLVRRGR